MSTPPFKNSLLQRFDPEIIDRLHLHPVDLPVGREIEYPGNHIDNLFFIEEGIASMTATFKDGVQVEIALAGFEAVLAASSMMGTRRSLNRVYMQVGGHGFSSAIEAATLEFKRGEKFQDLTLRYLQAQFIQSSQTAGCNARHSIEQRLARWLLLCADRNGGRILPLSHEYMADMLGASRTTVTNVAIHFQEQKLISYSRGKINLLDLPGLEKLSCECYAVVRDHLSNYADSYEGFGKS
ncbi:Crp/Fnr family transcriptional regulator [Granulicella arctica]|uniref:Crp/Fnr family transcriptional regulator n=1 Tax=Granulicella arctica TaxID=940613 RepID=UPI0021DFD71F|nr:Crp/Fnr family transcriptional regulator [Granulicella arctica]